MKALAAGALLLSLFFGILGAQNPEFSKLWGYGGELWKADGRLPDFSYAGYHRGEKQLPEREAELDVKAFGAVGDGEVDDTAAFQKAMVAAQGKVLAVPAGRYKISDILAIRSSHSVIRGAGPSQSILVFTRSLTDIKPNWGATTGGRRTSNYSWSGGLIDVTGSTSRDSSAAVAAPAKRGGRFLELTSCAGFEVGDDVRLEMRDTEKNSLARRLYAGDPGDVRNLKGRVRESFQFRITKVHAESRTIEFDRPLRTDVELEWKPRLFPAQASVEEVGIEGLGFEFPNSPYGGHFTEVGFNAISLRGVRNCWIKGLRIHNADSGIFVSAVNVTIEKILITSERKPERSRKATGHHGVTFVGQDNLLQDFEFRTRFIHELTVTRGAAGNVFCDGRGIDICFDHHRFGNHSNLYANIDLGIGSRMVQSGGGARLGRHSGAYETFWNIYAAKPQVWPKGWGPDRMNFIGVYSESKSVTDRQGRWFEVVSANELSPPNLYTAQRALRIGK